MNNFARLRAEIDVREFASHNAATIERFETDTLVEILEDQGEFLLINAKEIAHTPHGFVPREALVFPPADSQAPIFPFLNLDEGSRKEASVPPTLLLQTFLSWFDNGDTPPWISAEDWGQLDGESADKTITEIKASITANPALWQDWLDSVNSSHRQNEAVMDEWMIIAAGGRDVFPSRHYFFREDGSTSAKKIDSWILKGQVARWSGHMKVDPDNGRPFYKVDFFRRKKATHGWLRGDILSEYIFPTEDNNPKVPGNKDKIFDLSQPILRHPQDPEFADAKNAGRTGAQYLDIRGAIDRNLVHFCLCGEICVSALVGSDVIPLLRQWYESGYYRVNSILNNRHEGTHVGDLKNILELFGREGTAYNSTPVSAQFVKDNLLKGSFTISGCCITKTGKVKPGASIRHWVIVEDAVPVGSSGWVRIYNPFQNQEEVYEFDSFLSSSFSGTGLWIPPKVE